jgi:hypothetical protein
MPLQRWEIELISQGKADWDRLSTIMLLHEEKWKFHLRLGLLLASCVAGHIPCGSWHPSACLDWMADNEFLICIYYLLLCVR